MNIETRHESRRGCGWIAGLYEGEGSITTNHNGNGWAELQMSITSVDLEPLKWFRSIVGFGKIYGPYSRQSGRKPQFQWRGHGFENVKRFYDLTSSLLSKRRNDQLRTALAAKPRYDKTTHYRPNRDMKGRFTK